MPGYALGDRVDGQIERIVPGGRGLLRGPRGVVFVEQAAPGDRLLVEIVDIRSGAPRGSILEVLAPGPGRIDAACPWYGRCGGCDFQHLAYDAQLEAKRQLVRDALTRIGGIDDLPEIETFSAPRPFGSRARIELHADQEQHLVGLFERQSRRIVPIDQCMVSVPEIDSALQTIRRSLRPYPASIQLIGGQGDVRSSPPFLPIAGGSFWLRIDEFDYLVDPGAFFQSSLDLLPKLIERVLESCPDGDALAWDLFCGAGLFSLPLARRFQRVSGVDDDARSIRNASLGAHRNGTENAIFIAADACQWIAGRKQRALRPDLIVVDPPRSGLERRLSEQLITRSAKRLTYVSCDPATLARDLKLLLRAQYRIGDVAIFDLFPQTHHVETVVRLSRN